MQKTRAQRAAQNRADSPSSDQALASSTMPETKPWETDTQRSEQSSEISCFQSKDKYIPDSIVEGKDSKAVSRPESVSTLHFPASSETTKGMYECSGKLGATKNDEKHSSSQSDPIKTVVSAANSHGPDKVSLEPIVSNKIQEQEVKIISSTEDNQVSQASENEAENISNNKCTSYSKIVKYSGENIKGGKSQSKEKENTVPVTFLSTSVFTVTKQTKDGEIEHSVECSSTTDEKISVNPSQGSEENKRNKHDQNENKIFNQSILLDKSSSIKTVSQKERVELSNSESQSKGCDINNHDKDLISGGVSSDKKGHDQKDYQESTSCISNLRTSSLKQQTKDAGEQKFGSLFGTMKGDNNSKQLSVPLSKHRLSNSRESNASMAIVKAEDISFKATTLQFNKKCNDIAQQKNEKSEEKPSVDKKKKDIKHSKDVCMDVDVDVTAVNDEKVKMEGKEDPAATVCIQGEKDTYSSAKGSKVSSQKDKSTNDFKALKESKDMMQCLHQSFSSKDNMDIKSADLLVENTGNALYKDSSTKMNKQLSNEYDERSTDVSKSQDSALPQKLKLGIVNKNESLLGTGCDDGTTRYIPLSVTDEGDYLSASILSNNITQSNDSVLNSKLPAKSFNTNGTKEKAVSKSNDDAPKTKIAPMEMEDKGEANNDCSLQEEKSSTLNIEKCSSEVLNSTLLTELESSSKYRKQPESPANETSQLTSLTENKFCGARSKQGDTKTKGNSMMKDIRVVIDAMKPGAESSHAMTKRVNPELSSDTVDNDESLLDNKRRALKREGETTESVNSKTPLVIKTITAKKETSGEVLMKSRNSSNHSNLVSNRDESKEMSTSRAISKSFASVSRKRSRSSISKCHPDTICVSKETRIIGNQGGLQMKNDSIKFQTKSSKSKYSGTTDRDSKSTSLVNEEKTNDRSIESALQDKSKSSISRSIERTIIPTHQSKAKGICAKNSLDRKQKETSEAEIISKKQEGTSPNQVLIPCREEHQKVKSNIVRVEPIIRNEVNINAPFIGTPQTPAQAFSDPDIYPKKKRKVDNSSNERISNDTKRKVTRNKLKLNSNSFIGPSGSEIDSIKIELYLEGTRVHRGKGAERCFSDYWDSLGRYITAGVNGLRSMRSSRDKCTNGIEGNLKRFLKTKKLRRLHNDLILSLSKKCFHTKIPKKTFFHHIPNQWKPSIKIFDSNRIDILTSKSNQVMKYQVGSVQGGSSDGKRTDWYVSEERDMHDSKRWKQDFGTRSSIWNLSGQDHSTKFTYLENPSSVESPEDHFNPLEEGTKSVSSHLPGALQIHPLMERITRAEGMSASSSALWLIIVAVREHAASILKHTISDMESNSENRSSLMSTDFRRHRKRKVISSYDLARVLTSNPALCGGFRSSPLSRIAWERCLMGVGNKMTPAPTPGLPQVQFDINAAIEKSALLKCHKTIMSKSNAESCSNVGDNGNLKLASSQTSAPIRRVGISGVIQEKSASGCNNESNAFSSIAQRRSGLGVKGKDLSAMKARHAATSNSTHSTHNAIPIPALTSKPSSSPEPLQNNEPSTAQSKASVVRPGKRAGAKNLAAMRARSTGSHQTKSSEAQAASNNEG